jgi:hypothetical protein
VSAFWKRTILLSALALVTAGVLLFASVTTAQLHEAQRKIHSIASREPQSADPAQSFVEITLDTPPMAQLSSGFTGIAPSVHMIRLGSARPLSNLDPIEHPSRRRWGRIDFSFAFLIYLPIALIPLAFLIYRHCTQPGDIEKLLSGRSSIFDFSIERILLPLLGSAGFVGLVTIACLYTSGLRVPTNEMLARLSIWGLLLILYLSGWTLLYAYLLLRVRSFPIATIYYGATFLLIAFLLPQFLQTATMALERPRGRLPLIVERRKLAQQVRRDDHTGIDRFLAQAGYSPLDWSVPLPAAQFVALENLRIEQKVQPELEALESSVQRIDRLTIFSSWLSPYLVAQFGIDDLAGTGLARYSAFRAAAIQYHDQWQKYLLGFLARRQFLDFDALKSAPRFRFSGNDNSEILPSVLARCTYLAFLCLMLCLAIRRRLRQLLPGQKK